MSIELVPLLVTLGLLLVLMAARVPVAFCLGFSGAVGILFLEGFSNATGTIGAIPFSKTASYTLTLIPMFIVMGLFVSHAGLLSQLFSILQRCVGWLPGGLGVATVAACAFFGGISGSSVADAATLGRLSIGEMSKRGYPVPFAAAVVASASTAAIMIPPSIVLVIYGILTRESIGMLLLAGNVPGVLTAVAYALVIIMYATSGKLANEPAGGAAAAPGATGNVAASGRELPSRRATRIRGAYGLMAGMTLFLIVIGGIYTGWFTATEAGAVGAAASLVLSLIYVFLSEERHRWLGRSWRTTRDASLEAGRITATVFALLIGAAIFTQFLVIARIPVALTEWILGLSVSPYVVVALFLLAMLPLGMLIDGLSMLLIVTPIAYPIIDGLGFDGIWFGILLVKLIEIGLITPPVGLNVYVVAGLFKDVSAESVFRCVTPFVIADLLLAACLFFIPEIVLWLPGLSNV